MRKKGQRTGRRKGFRLPRFSWGAWPTGRRRRRVARWWLLLVPVLVAAVVWPIGCNHQQPPVSNLTAGRPTVRVRIIDHAQQIKLAATQPPTIRSTDGSTQKIDLPKGSTISLTPAGWQVGEALLPPGELTVEPESDGDVSIEGTAYRGSYHLVPVGGGAFDVVNHLDIEAYLKGVLARELMPEFEPEAYKAQAIVARTYAIYVARTAPPGRHWDLHADTKSQMYGGIKGESPKSRAATEDTTGVVVAYGPPGQEKIFKAYFSSCCGGATQSVTDAFHEPLIQPLTERYVGPRCDTSAGIYHARFNWGPITITKAELTRRFRIYGKSRNRPEKDMGTIERLDVFRANSVGRPIQFVVTDGRNTSYLFSGEELRVAVNTSAPSDSTLPSSFVTPVTDPTAIRFTNGHGFGHGVGMCQWCAQAEAHQGIPHEQIVVEAYPGAKLVKAY